MTLTKTFSAALFALTLLVASALQAVASGPATPLTLLYDPSNGNLKLQNTTATTGSYNNINILTEASNGGIGWLTGPAANIPSGANTVQLNNNNGGENGLASQVFFTNFPTVAVISGMVLSPNPDWSSAAPQPGPAGSFWDLGNIAVTGMTQAQLDVRFTTSPDITPGFEAAPGKFLVAYDVVGAPVTGAILQVVPEPSTYAMMVAGVAAAGFMVKRRRKTA